MAVKLAVVKLVVVKLVVVRLRVVKLGNEARKGTDSSGDRGN